MRIVALALGSAILLAGCEATPTAATKTLDDGREVNSTLPDEVIALAAPGQDLASAVMLEDNCFWYRYTGPVETTMLPLRASNGRPICVAAPAAPA
jgi:hypothetical protein